MRDGRTDTVPRPERTQSFSGRFRTAAARKGRLKEKENIMLSKFDTDLGTPARESDVQVTLEIDGAAVTVPAGTSIMHAAMTSGVKVPKLCATDALEPFGSCRLCLVEIEGRKGYPASCTTP